ncbi:hypothetical protein GR11A_00047 [Vibrio phage vB_VcorM_GR11A]|nr:hypothetical protein GR11A_00047 [Vibrio phage vB_VcorM_GR11A]
MEFPIRLTLDSEYRNDYNLVVDTVRSQDDIAALRNLRSDENMDSMTYVDTALEDDDPIYLVRESGTDDVVAMLTMRLEPSRSHLLSIFVSPEWEGVGVGYTLTKFAVTLRPTTYLYVATVNERAIGVYTGVGFTKCHVCPMFDTEGDALLMEYTS